MARLRPVVKCLKFHLLVRGRLSRLSYFLVLLIACFLLLLITVTGYLILLSRSLDLPILTVVLYNKEVNPDNFASTATLSVTAGLLWAWIVITSTVKRLHDLNRSGLWLIFPILTIPIGIILIVSQQFMLLIALMNLGTFIFLSFTIWLLIMPGTIGENCFGKDSRTKWAREILRGQD